MAFVINYNVMADRLNRKLEKARQENADSLEKLSTGQVFTQQDPRPSERAIAEGMEYRLRSLAASKKNMNDAISLIQTGEEALAEINNLMTRMKEINIAAAGTTITDRDRRFLFIEYEALFNEVNRVAITTEFNGLPLINGESEEVPESLIFRLDDPVEDTTEDGEGDINIIRFDGIKEVVATTEGLGLRSATDLLIESEEDEEGIAIEDVEELMLPEDEDEFTTVYDEALSRLSAQRAVFGAMQTRLNRAIDYNMVYSENIAAARSKIADTDYAKEVSRLTQNRILTQATTGLLAHNNADAHTVLGLIGSAVK